MEKLKVVLVDDECIVLNGIKTLLRREPDLELVGAADNGLDGLKLVLEEKPEIVLTDIRMPGTSGLELIRQAKEVLPDTVYIIFSGYNEFRYVKEAIGLGVIDYLEKPVTIEKLRKAIGKGIQTYHYRHRYAEMTHHMKRAEQTYVERALRQVYQRAWDGERDLEQVLEQNPRLEYASSVCVMKLARREGQDLEECRQVLQPLCNQLAQTHQVDIYAFSEYENLVQVFFLYDQDIFDFQGGAVRCGQRLDEEGLGCYIGISRVHGNFYHLRTAFTEADDAIRYARYLEETAVVSIDQVEYSMSVPKDLTKDQNSIGFNFRAGQYTLCQEQVGDYLGHLKQMDLMPELFYQKCMELMYILNWLLQEMDQTQNHCVDLVYPARQKSFSADSLAAWTLDRTGHILELAARVRSTEKNQAVQFAKGYIDQHFQEGISLDIIAERVHMSPTYLSMLFKREEGTTYIRYLTKVRMEKAMEYIRQGRKAKEVCELVGYFDYKHFTTQFKTYTGMTVGAYRQKFLPLP